MYDVVMSDLRFDWDERKNRANQQKHGVAFEEAESVFADENALLTRIPSTPKRKTGSSCSD